MKTIAVNLYQIGALQTAREPISKATLGAQQLKKIVSEANDGVPVPPLFPGNIHLTDNSRIYFVSADNGDAGCEQ